MSYIPIYFWRTDDIHSGVKLIFSICLVQILATVSYFDLKSFEYYFPSGNAREYHHTQLWMPAMGDIA
jgi:hypothetical protein